MILYRHKSALLVERPSKKLGLFNPTFNLVSVWYMLILLCHASLYIYIVFVIANEQVALPFNVVSLQRTPSVILHPILEQSLFTVTLLELEFEWMVLATQAWLSLPISIV